MLALHKLQAYLWYGNNIRVDICAPHAWSDGSLSKFAQSQECFIFNFVNISKICQADLYAMYCDPANKYGYHWFFQFWNLMDDVNHAIFII